MPDLGHEVADFQVSTWKLSKWRTLEKKLTGPPFACGGHNWWVVLQILDLASWFLAAA